MSPSLERSLGCAEFWDFFLLWRRVFVLFKRSPQREGCDFVFMSSEDDCVKWREGLFCTA